MKPTLRPSKTNTDVPLFFPSITFQACETPRREIQPGRGEGILGREVLNHHCGGAAGPTYRNPHLEANRRIARARKKYMMRNAPRAAATTKGTISIVTSAILAGGFVGYGRLQGAGPPPSKAVTQGKGKNRSIHSLGRTPVAQDDASEPGVLVSHPCAEKRARMGHPRYVD